MSTLFLLAVVYLLLAFPVAVAIGRAIHFGMEGTR